MPFADSTIFFGPAELNVSQLQQQLHEGEASNHIVFTACFTAVAAQRNAAN
jgi:hypothetical protein